MKKTIVVGMNVGHDGGCALLIDGEVKVAISEERLNRMRYSSGWISSLFYCLQAENVSIEEVDLFVFSSCGPYLPEDYDGGLKALGVPQEKITSVDHHLSHAYSAFSYSGFEEALIPVIDGEGNIHVAESFYVGKGNTIERVSVNDTNRNRAKGIGRTYEAFTNYFGWTDQDSGKTMGLASFGDPKVIGDVPLFEVSDGQVNSKLEKTHEIGVVEFAQQYGLNFGTPYGKGETQIDADVAAYLQKETEEVLLKLIQYWSEKTGMKKVAYAGGVALNCVANTRISTEIGLEELFVIPAASDRGQSLGNALYGYHKLTGEIPKKRLTKDYFGREYTEAEILDALNRMPISLIKKPVPTISIEWEKSENIAQKVAELLVDGKIVGWFQGGSELGPRALGHRSIVTDPRSSQIKDTLNKRVKHREPFRPFAPSGLLEHASEFFEIETETPYMLLTPQVRPEKKSVLQAITHTDGTARLQTVTKEDNDKYYELISNFYKLTGVPVVLDTSFNDNEPIVETPADAVFTFMKTDIDYLAIGDYLVTKKRML